MKKLWKFIETIQEWLLLAFAVIYFFGIYALAIAYLCGAFEGV